MTFAFADDLPGRVWATGKPAWVSDVAQDPEFRRASLAGRAGLHSAFAVPLRRRGEVSGIMTLFSRQERRPQGDLLLRSLLLLPVGVSDAQRLFASR